VPVATVPDTAAPRGDQPEEALPDEDLWSALAALPDKQRQCVAYHHVAGLPHTEVARIVGGTPTAARRAASDGIARLRSTYAPNESVSTHV
jgi:DNA-directed RNA polymerase specialized sigma24 family protein